MVKNLQAYWMGKFGCNDLDSKILSTKIFNYDKDQLKYFVRGILRSRRCIQLSNDCIVYISNSIIQLTLLQSIFKQLDITTSIITTSTIKHMIIYCNDIIRRNINE